MSKVKVLIIGASGTVGSELAKILNKKGVETLLATSKKSEQPDKVYLDLATGDGVKEAFSQADRAFLLSPPGYANQYEILSPLIKVAKEKSLEKVVLMTAMGANADESSPFRRAEVELEKSGLRYNIIRPNWFLQNFNTFWIQGINKNDHINLPAGDAKVSFIDARDISEVAAKLLLNDKYDNLDFDLSGLNSYSHDQVAQSISKVSGREVSYNDIEPSVLKDQLISSGLPIDYVDFLILIFGYLKEGYNSKLTDNVEKITGHKARSLEDYVRDYKELWITK